MRTHPSAPTSRVDQVVLVVGCGLVGGSLAALVRSHCRRTRIVAIDKPSVTRAARMAGVIDAGASLHALETTIARERPDIVLLALPVASIVAALPRVAAAARGLAPEARPLVLDVASVKRDIVEAAERAQCPRFVGGHPMAGSERTGFANATKDLLEGAMFVLCPSQSCSRRDLAHARAFVRKLGFEVSILAAEMHDDTVALVSHLPHVLAWVLMETGRAWEAARPRARSAGLPWSLAAGAWKDATRVAMADPHAWSEILRRNRGPVRRTIQLLVSILRTVEASLEFPRGSNKIAGLAALELGRLRARMVRFARQRVTKGDHGKPESNVHGVRRTSSQRPAKTPERVRQRK